jgi:hypothetical protein
VEQARSFTRGCCDGWLVAPSTRAAAVAIVAELVDNAVRHARTTLDVSLELADNELIIRVHDGSPAPPVPLPTTGAEAEHGLDVVAHRGSRWGYTCTVDGKCVWVTLDLSPTTGRLRRPDRSQWQSASSAPPDALSHQQGVARHAVPR